MAIVDSEIDVGIVFHRRSTRRTLRPSQLTRIDVLEAFCGFGDIHFLI